VRPGRLPTAFTVARVQAIEISLNWRWVPVLVLGTWLLAHTILPAKFPGWGFETNWMTASVVVLAGELGLFLHELSHALVARGRGQPVLRIVFHGFQAETVCGAGMPTPRHEALIALVGPAMNLLLAVLMQTTRLMLADTGPLDVTLLLLVLGNLGTAAMSLVPVGASDGGRALSAWRRARARS
jgi:Zn-dependent protease